MLRIRVSIAHSLVELLISNNKTVDFNAKRILKTFKIAPAKIFFKKKIQ